MKYLITYVDLVDGMDKIQAIIYSQKNLKLEMEESDEVENNMVQRNNGRISGGEQSVGNGSADGSSGSDTGNR